MSNYFYKVMVGGWKTKLRIPKLFVSCHKLKPKIVTLINASSKRPWMVNIERDEEDPGELYFKTNWPGFVKDNAIEPLDFLTFKFDGNYRFKVLICGQSSCEKSLEVKARMNLNNPTKPSPVASTHHQHLRENRKGKDPIRVKLKKARQDSHDFEAAGTAHSVNEEEYDEDDEQESSTDESTEGSDSDSQKNPSFKILMQPAYAEKGVMCFPTEFFHKYMKNKRQEVEIETVRGVWTVSLLPHMKRTRTFARLSKGWSEFAKANQFKTGETLVFELIRKGDHPKFVMDRK